MSRRTRTPVTYARLTTPLVRDDGVLRPATWPEALERAAAGFTRVLAASGGRGETSVGVFSCSKATNEVNYLVEKFARTALGTNNIDSCNRT
jgi:formate dehydrogenase major subunit